MKLTRATLAIIGALAYTQAPGGTLYEEVVQGLYINQSTLAYVEQVDAWAVHATTLSGQHGDLDETILIPSKICEARTANGIVIDKSSGSTAYVPISIDLDDRDYSESPPHIARFICDNLGSLRKRVAERSINIVE